MRPILLTSNRPADRFYRGGDRIAAFRGETARPTHEPEDWVASVTPLAGDDVAGLTSLPDGRLLADAVRTDPVAWLGADHVARFGDDTRLLVKLLDAGQRLPVHAHPDGAFASAHLARAHGKAEAWFIVEGGDIHLGLTRDVSPEELAALVAAQDTAALLGLLHRRRVDAGDVVFVPPGVLHAIGAGVFLVEVQEPEDLSILLEWEGFELDGARDGHLGLGFELALAAVDRRALSATRLEELVRPAGFGTSVLPVGSEPYFRLGRHRVAGDLELERGFRILVVLDGSLELGGPDRPRIDAGTTVLLADAAGEVRLSGNSEVVVARPPAA